MSYRPEPDEFDIDDEVERCPECGCRLSGDEPEGSLCSECMEAEAQEIDELAKPIFRAMEDGLDCDDDQG